MKEFMPSEEQKILIDAARSARDMSYSPYSHFRVGAALITSEGKIFSGCNIESAAFSPTNCAERTAFFTAVSQGEREFSAIAVVGAMAGSHLAFCMPCGVCRQVMQEFCDPETFEIWVSREDYLTHSYSLKELLPEGFGPDQLI
jgi:cytidine deaminase